MTILIENSPTPTEPMALTPKQQRFAEEYLVDLNATQAAIRAGYSKRSAGQQGEALLKKHEIQEKIQSGREKISQSTQITAEAVLNRWWELANADARELSQFRHYACRYCHGIDHGYQWIDEAEWAQSLAAAQREDENAVVDNSGGYGYRRTEDPHPDCPHCEGEGIPETWFADTRKLSPGAAALFDGVKQTQNGIEIKTLSREKALENVARHLGMFTDRIDHTSSDGSMTPQPAIDASKLSTETLKELRAARDSSGTDQ